MLRKATSLFTVFLSVFALTSFLPITAQADMSVDSYQANFAYQQDSVLLAQAEDETLLTAEVNATPNPTAGDVLGTQDLEFPPKGFAPTLLPYINSILTIVMVLALALVLFNFIMAGINWITAGGDKGKTEEARSRMVNAVVGILIVSASFAVLRFVGYFLGFENFADVISSIIPIS